MAILTDNIDNIYDFDSAYEVTKDVSNNVSRVISKGRGIALHQPTLANQPVENGDGFEFDGTDYLETIGFDYSQDFTLESWLYIDDTSAYYIFEQRWGAQDSANQFHFYCNVGSLILSIRENNNVSSKTATITYPVAEWFHLMIVYKSGVFKIIQNGICVGILNKSISTIAQVPFLWGQFKGNTANGLKGKIDKFRCNKDTSNITQSEGQPVFTPPTYPNTILSGSAGKILTDASGNIYANKVKRGQILGVDFDDALPNRVLYDGSNNLYQVTDYVVNLPFVSTAAAKRPIFDGINKKATFDGVDDYLLTSSAVVDWSSDWSFLLKVGNSSLIGTTYIYQHYLDSNNFIAVYYTPDSNICFYAKIGGVVKFTGNFVADISNSEILAVHESATGTVHLFINKTRISQLVFGIGFLPLNFSGVMSLGANTTGALPLNGYISDVELFNNNVLTTDELTSGTYTREI